MTRAEVEEAIATLEALLRAKDIAEREFQTHFEQNPFVLTTLGYQRWVPRPRLPLRDGGYYEPDFIAQLPSSISEILDLKTPDERLLLDRPRRARFTAKLEEYISQLHDYEEYFDDETNRAESARLLGFSVQKAPAMVIVVGRDATTDKLLLHQQIRRRNSALRIVTYDDVLSALLRAHAQMFGTLEDLSGASFFCVVKFRSHDADRRKYLIDVASGNSRWSIYLDREDSLTFELTGREGRPYVVAVLRGQGGFDLDRFFLLTCEFGSGDNLSIMQIRINDRIVAELRLAVPLAIAASLDIKNGTIGADLTGSNHGNFDLAELMAYDHVLTFRERLQLVDYIFEKYPSLVE